MIKELKMLNIYSRMTLPKSISSKRGDVTMNANSKNFEVELMAQEQTTKKVPMPAKLQPAKIL